MNDDHVFFKVLDVAVNIIIDQGGNIIVPHGHHQKVGSLGHMAFVVLGHFVCHIQSRVHQDQPTHLAAVLGSRQCRHQTALTGAQQKNFVLVHPLERPCLT